jgi:hypothetical protein
VNATGFHRSLRGHGFLGQLVAITQGLRRPTDPGASGLTAATPTSTTLLLALIEHLEPHESSGLASV